MGSSTTRFALVIWTLTEIGAPAAYRLLLVASFLPLGLGGMIAGLLIDRWYRRTILIVSNVCASLSTLAVAILWFTDSLSIWHLFIAMFANGIANSSIVPAFEASVQLLVLKEQLGWAAGLSQILAALEMIAGPALAGILLSTVGLAVIFLADFVTFGFVVLALVFSIIPPLQGAKIRQPRIQISLRN